MLQPITISKSCKSESGDPQDTPSLKTSVTSTPSNTWEWLQVMEMDFQIIFDRDRLARNWVEVCLFYPGWHALVLHRLANWLYLQGIPFFPRFLSYLGRWISGMEIHPGASVGRGVFIDRPMGVVIGETAIIGDYCRIYQDVTLGGTGKQRGKRHPTIGKNVTIKAGAKVLGNIKIGDRVSIGAGAVVLQDVPDDCTVVGIPGRIISPTKDNSIGKLTQRIEQIEEQLRQLTIAN